MKSPSFFAVAVMNAIMSLVGACSAPVDEVVGCQSNADCGDFFRCDTARGLCLCLDDNACDESEFCNVAGRCQPLTECLGNEDCRSADNPNGFCDVTTGACITRSASLQCVLDDQCPFGSTCANNVCVAGCNEDGDCPLGQPCIGGQCNAQAGACSNNSFCEFGQICNTTTNRCADHAQRDQLCQTCDPQSFGSACGANDCLIDNSVAPTVCANDGQCERGSCLSSQCLTNADCFGGGTCTGAIAGFGIPGTCSTKICQGFFCGASGCSESNPCPRGYTCSKLQVVTGVQCQLGSNECGAGRECQGGGENGNVGFCSCATDDDCPAGAGATCEDGGCIIGTTCGPASGLLCEDVLQP